MYHGSICHVRAMITQSSAVFVWPSHGIPVSKIPSAFKMLFRIPYWPLKIQLQRKPMAVPGIIQLTHAAQKFCALEPLIQVDGPNHAERIG